MSRIRNWCFTSFESATPDFSNESTSYYLYQRELCPNTLREHWQGCVKFANARNFNGLRKRWPLWHWEPARNWAAAKKYCSKLDSRISDPVEFGTDSVPAWQSQSPTDLWESSADWMLRNHRGYAAYRNSIQPSSRVNRVIYIWGQTGVGKSRAVMDYATTGTSFWHSGTKWWDGYMGQHFIILDDFRGQWDYEYLLRILDRYPMKVETKGGWTNLESATIFITSNLPLTELYNCDLAPLRRRINFYMHAESNIWIKMN